MIIRSPHFSRTKLALCTALLLTATSAFAWDNDPGDTGTAGEARGDYDGVGGYSGDASEGLSSGHDISAGEYSGPSGGYGSGNSGGFNGGYGDYSGGNTTSNGGSTSGTGGGPGEGGSESGSKGGGDNGGGSGSGGEGGSGGGGGGGMFTNVGKNTTSSGSTKKVVTVSKTIILNKKLTKGRMTQAEVQAQVQQTVDAVQSINVTGGTGVVTVGTTDAPEEVVVDSDGWQEGEVVISCPENMAFTIVRANGTSNPNLPACSIDSNNCHLTVPQCKGEKECTLVTSKEHPYYSGRGVCREDPAYAAAHPKGKDW